MLVRDENEICLTSMEGDFKNKNHSIIKGHKKMLKVTVAHHGTLSNPPTVLVLKFSHATVPFKATKTIFRILFILVNLK